MKANLERLFVQGKYLELLKNSFDSENYLPAPQDFALLIGALVFAGRGVEAFSFFQRHEVEIDPRHLVEIRFYLIIDHTRAGATDRARALLPRSESKAVDERERFFRYQSIAFFNYYLGKRAQAKEAAKLALEAAIEWRSLWARVLALDLLSHLNFQDGQIQQALKSFDQGLQTALKIGNQNLAAALAINVALYRAQVTVPSLEAIETLETVFRETRVEDAYSRANILLELARQATLTGQWKKAETYLNRALTFIYQFGNAKQEVLLNFRWSYLSFCQGEFEKALNFISVSKSKLELVREEAVTLAVTGLELDLIERMPFDDAFRSGRRAAASAVQSSNESHVNQRLLARRTGLSIGRRGEDPFADWLDQLQASESPRDLILASGAFGLLKSKDLIPRDGASFVVDFESRTVVCSDAVSTEVIEFGSRKRLFELFCQLLDGFKARRELFEDIWKAKYVPRLHDSVIYANLTNLRKILNRFAAFLQTGEKGYAFDPDLRIVISGSSSSSSPSSTLSRRPEENARAGLEIKRQIKFNERQVKLLESLGLEQVIDTRTYSMLFKISTATANRDLRELFAAKKLSRLGRSRDIAYRISYCPNP